MTKWRYLEGKNKLLNAEIMTSMLTQLLRSVNIGSSPCNLKTTNLCQPLINVITTTIRTKKIRIRGGGRPVPPGVTPPEPSKYGWRPILPADGKYTIRPLPIQKLGGRDPKTGRVIVATIGGGHKKKFRWVDFMREGSKDGTILEEKVLMVRYDPCRTADIALVASDNHPRWIIAHEHMKAGDIIKTSSVVPRIAIRANYGDAHPLGALPVGTLVHNIEFLPGSGGSYCRSAGTSAQILRKIGERVIIQLPSKEQVSLQQECMAVVGRVSNPDHGKKPIGSAQRHRWLGKRPRSGLWHRKDGYCGRKIHPPKPLKVISGYRETKQELFQLNI